MPLFKRDQVTIHYEVHGEGFPLLALAPGGLRSASELWRGKPIDPREAFAGDYRVITMDQRNAGQSWAPISASDGWHSYARDQIALLDHLGIERCHVIGMCIGGAFILQLAHVASERLASAVLLQPIGLEQNRHVFLELATSFYEQVRGQHPEVSESDFAAFTHNMFGGDFVYSVSPDDVRRCPVPLLVTLGDDVYHPASISRKIVELAPHAALIESWKQGPERARAIGEVRAFMALHTP